MEYLLETKTEVRESQCSASATLMLQKLDAIRHLIGETPLRQIQVPGIRADVYAKLEYYNLIGSIKDRPAYSMLRHAIEAGQINQETVIVESSSGNFALAMAGLCKLLGLKFIPVIDPNINPGYEKKLRLFCDEVFKVTKVDKTGGYLLTRLEVVNEFISSEKHVFWPNQYSNPQNYLAYYNLMGCEIGDRFERLDYAFIAVSTCGTVTGMSMKLKEQFPAIKIVAVDVEGSVIFGRTPQKRYISGIGSSMVPPLLEHAIIDDVIHLSQPEIVKGCHELLDEQFIFAGASSGAAYGSIKKYFAGSSLDTSSPTVLFVCPDGGDAYLDTIYSASWTERLKSAAPAASVAMPNL